MQSHASKHGRIIEHAWASAVMAVDKRKWPQLRQPKVGSNLLASARRWRSRLQVVAGGRGR